MSNVWEWAQWGIEMAYFAAGMGALIILGQSVLANRQFISSTSLAAAGGVAALFLLCTSSSDSFTTLASLTFVFAAGVLLVTVTAPSSDPEVYSDDDEPPSLIPASSLPNTSSTPNPNAPIPTS